MRPKKFNYIMLINKLVKLFNSPLKKSNPRRTNTAYSGWCCKITTIYCVCLGWEMVFQRAVKRHINLSM